MTWRGTIGAVECGNRSLRVNVPCSSFNTAHQCLMVDVIISSVEPARILVIPLCVKCLIVAHVSLHTLEQNEQRMLFTCNFSCDTNKVHSVYAGTFILFKSKNSVHNLCHTCCIWRDKWTFSLHQQQCP